ncbi:MAG: hypothetical protein M0006_13145 [Magnetospirillum sp.]|nr:hypothetical protein [Magnetospirillum sp.]
MADPLPSLPPPSLDALRARIRTLEQGGTHGPGESLPLFPEIDRALPGGGLALACLHQLVAADSAGTAFAALIAGRLAERKGRPVLWAPVAEDLYPPGLAAWGLVPERLIVVRAAAEAERLWVMEEALRCPDLACVVAEIAGLDLIAGRRLQLAAEAGRVTGLALHPPPTRAANAGTTRWRVGALPGGRWHLALERCRGGMPGEWTVAPDGVSGEGRDAH